MCFVSSGKTIGQIGQYKSHIVCSDIDYGPVIDIDQSVTGQVVGYTIGTDTSCIE